MNGAQRRGPDPLLEGAAPVLGAFGHTAGQTLEDLDLIFKIVQSSSAVGTLSSTASVSCLEKSGLAAAQAA